MVSPDGTKIAFGRSVNAQHSIWVMNANGAGAHVLVTTARLNRLSGTLPVDELADISWSPDGSQLAFTAATGNADQGGVFTVGADGTGLQRLTPHAAGIWGASWSPDGKRIASMDRSKELVTMRADGTHIRHLGYRPPMWVTLAWNPARPVKMPPHR